MQTFKNEEFRRGEFADRDSAAVYDGFEFYRCYFQSYFLSLTSTPALRSTIRNVRLTDCSQRGCTLYSAVVENAVIDGFRTNGQLFRAHGAVFNSVILHGRIDRLMLSNDVLPSVLMNGDAREHVIDAFREANAEYYRHVGWALDISQGEFKELDIRGIPARLIRRDPETQVVVTRQRVLRHDWRDLDFRAAITPFSLNLMLKWESPDMVLVAPKRSPEFHACLEDLRLLREAGVAEPD